MSRNIYYQVRPEAPFIVYSIVLAVRRGISIYDSLCRTHGVLSRGVTKFFPRFQEISSGRDEFTVFAEHVAIRLKNITDARARLVAQHQINNILFEAEMGKYSMHSYSTTMLENLDEPSTSNDEKMIMNIPQAV